MSRARGDMFAQDSKRVGSIRLLDGPQATGQAVPAKQLQAVRNANRSALIWSLLVEHMPCGKPG